MENKVKEVRERLDIRQKDLAQIIGVSREYLHRIEKNLVEPRLSVACKLEKALKHPLKDLFLLKDWEE